MLINSNLLDALRATSASVAKATERLATGKQLTSAADNPPGFVQMLSTKETISSAGVATNTLDMGMYRLEQRDSVLSSMEDMLLHFKELATKSGGNMSPADIKNTIAPEIGQMQDAIVSLANSKDDTGYVFAGTAANTTPFVKDPVTQTVTYAGSTTSQTISVEGMTLTGAMNGTPLLKVMDAMQSIAFATAAGNAATSTQLQALDKAFEEVSNIRTTGAAQSSAAQQLQDALAKRINLYTDQVSKLELTDYAQESVNLSQSQTQYQANLQVLSMELNRKRLMDYL